MGSEFRKTIVVSFVDQFNQIEQGVDMGGVFKEFLEESCRIIFSENYGLFKTNDQSMYYPNPICIKHLPEAYSVIEFVGRLLAKAVYEGSVTYIFIKQLKGQQNIYDIQ